MRALKIAALAALASVIAIVLVSCALEYAGERKTVDGVTYFISGRGDKCFAASAEYSGSDEIKIPDEVDGAKVVALGGRFTRSGFPEEFRTVSAGSLYPLSLEEIPEGSEVRDKVIKLSIGKNVSKIHLVANGYIEDGGVFYRITYYVEADGANRYFYSRDGKLYSAGGNLVDLFDYAE